MFNACNHTSNIDEQIPDIVSYNFNIRPILSDKCYKCHGPDASKRQAGLRLDKPESAFKALRDKPACACAGSGQPGNVGAVSQGFHQRHFRNDAPFCFKPKKINAS